MARYFIGKPSDLGNVLALPQETFAALCDDIIRKPVLLPLSREALHALPKDRQDVAKRTRYLTPCTFKTSPSIRTKGNAGPCNLIFLDIDDPADARRLLDSHWPTMLKGYAHLVHHTARSTPTKPRLRIIVSADGIPADQYPLAVEHIAARVGVRVTRESLVVVQPMFLPATFQHDTFDPVIIYEPNAGDVTVASLRDPEATPELPAKVAPLPNEDTGLISDLSHFRAPIEGVTLEDASGATEHIDPDCSMMQWIEIGAALKHQFGDSAFDLWNAWSAKGKKYTSLADTRYRWDSLKGQTKDRVPVTIRSLFRVARAHGWANDRLAKQAFADTLEWLRNPDRSTEELFDRGAERIARVTPIIGEMERSTLIRTLGTRLKSRGMAPDMAAIRRSVERLEIETERQLKGIPPWVAGLVFVTSGGFFYRYTVDRRFTSEVIDLMYSAPNLGEKTPPRTSVYLMKQAQIPQVENLRYEPAQGEKKIFAVGGVPYVNNYRQTFAKAEPKGLKEAAGFVERHLEALIAEPELRTLLLDFLCFLVQQPGRKVRWAPMIQSTKGAGKGWLSEMLEIVLGYSNVMKVGPSGILDNQYNDWAYGQQIVILEEIRVVGHNRYEVMDKLKPLITDDHISLNVKFESQRKVPNITNYLLFTNHHDALAIQDDERRYFVIQSKLQTAQQVKDLGGDAYFTPLYEQLKKNPGGLRAYFETRKISAGFNPDGRAPVTTYLHDLAVASASPLAAAILMALEDQPHPLVRKDLVSLTALRDLLEEKKGLGHFSDQAMSAVLREAGWVRALRARVQGSRHQFWTNGFTGDVKAAADDRIANL